MEDYERKYYVPWKDEPTFKIPHGEKSHFMAHCCEFEELKTEKKLADFGYLVTHGYDLVAAVREYLTDRPEYHTSICQAFVEYLEYLHGDIASFIAVYNMDGVISLDQMVELCSKEVAQRYFLDYEKDYRSGNYYRVPSIKDAPAWEEDKIGKLVKQSGKSLAELLLLTTEEMLQMVEEFG